MLRPKPIPEEQSRAILEKARNHYTKHDWQHMR